MKKEMVNHPKHYNKEGRKECIDELIDMFGLKYTIIWALMTAYKYRYRIGAKDDRLQETGKIHWYEKWVSNKIESLILPNIEYEEFRELVKRYIDFAEEDNKAILKED